MPRGLRRHLLLGEAAKFVVDQRPQPILSPGVAAVHGREKLGHGTSCGRCHSASRKGTKRSPAMLLEPRAKKTAIQCRFKGPGLRRAALLRTTCQVWDTFPSAGHAVSDSLPPLASEPGKTMPSVRSNDACIFGTRILTEGRRFVTLALICHHGSHGGSDGLERGLAGQIT
jgi:hypothetical protein